MNNRIETISAEELYYTPIPQKETEMIVEDMIPQGLTILAGPPKSCKSWLVLDMGICVSAGAQFLGKSTLGCGVLYFALEDTRSRLQSRFHSIDVDEPPASMHFATGCPPLGGALLKELDEWIRGHPDIRLVIIDTLQKIRKADKGTSGINQYGKDTDELSMLKDFADRKHIAIVVVHHVTKRIDPSDPVNDIRGSAGMSAIPDSILILRKERMQKAGELLCVSRDLPQWKMTLHFERCRWYLKDLMTEEEIIKEKIPEVLFRISDMIKRCGRWEGTMTKLLEEVHESEMNPTVLSRKLAEFGYEVFLMEDIRIDHYRTSSERKYIFTHEPEEENQGKENNVHDDETSKNEEASSASQASQMSPDELQKRVQKARETILRA